MTLEHAPSLEKQWEDLKARDPGLRIRDAAEKLGTSEGRLLTLGLGAGVRRLRCDPAQILPALEPLGPLMALTRNTGAVLENHGTYRQPKIQGNIGLYNTPEIDLRLDFKTWSEAFMEHRVHRDKVLRSLQFFDAQGTALHKIYLESEDRAPQWEELLTPFLHPQQEGVFPDRAPTPPPVAPEEPLSPGMAAGVLESWKSLKDPHHFGALLKKARVSRLQALRSAEGTFTRFFSLENLKPLLKEAARREVPLMIFVGNPGCIQISTGAIKAVSSLGTWLNILDPGVNLHLQTTALSQAWMVEKPSPEGLVTSLEFYDARGDLVVQFFGARKPGIPEREDWRTLVKDFL